MPQDLIKAFDNADNYETIAYVVENENTLGYLSKVAGKPVMGVLHGSVLKGSNRRDMDCVSLYGDALSELRLASRKDFAEFRVQVPSAHNGPTSTLPLAQ